MSQLQALYALPAALLRKQAIRVTILAAKRKRELSSLDGWEIEYRSENLLCYAITVILRTCEPDKYIPDDEHATAEVLLSLLWKECCRSSYAFGEYMQKILAVSDYLFNSYDLILGESSSEQP